MPPFLLCTFLLCTFLLCAVIVRRPIVHFSFCARHLILIMHLAPYLTPRILRLFTCYGREASKVAFWDEKTLLISSASCDLQTGICIVTGYAEIPVLQLCSAAIPKFDPLACTKTTCMYRSEHIFNLSCVDAIAFHLQGFAHRLTVHCASRNFFRRVPSELKRAPL